jgi:4-amino-4-deoxy-L-arabinose transferase
LPVTANREHLHLLLGLFFGLLFFVNLGSYGLLEDNEARFLEIAWEMKESGDLVVPKLNYISHFHKPPATFWIESLSLKMLGDSEAAARLPVVLASIATVLLTSFFFTDSRKRMLVALILASNPEFWFLSRTVLTDMYLCLTVTACMVSAHVLMRKKSPATAAVFWSSAALSGLVKGPVGPIIVALALVSLHLWNKLSGRPNVPWKNWMGLRGLALFCLISLPWYIAVCLRFPHLLNYFVEYQIVQRVATEVHGRGGPPWFYVPVILVGFLPWSLALPQALFHAIRKADLLDRFLVA